MAPRKWDAYRFLNIMPRGSEKMTCVGKAKSRGSKSCRWDIPASNIQQIRRILNDIEKDHPRKARYSLQQLAELSLCNEAHQNQVSEKLAEWRSDIQDATADYEEREALRSHISILKKELKEDEKVPRKQLSATIDRLALDLLKQKTTSTKYKSSYRDLKEANEQLESQLERKVEEVEKVTKDMEMLIGNQVSELSEMRREVKACKSQAKQNSDCQIKIAAELRSNLERERRQSAEKSISLDGMGQCNERLATEKAALQGQLAELKEEAIQLRAERNETITQRDTSYDQNSGFRSQLLNKDNEIEELSTKLFHIERVKDNVSKDCQRLQQELASQIQDSDDFLNQTSILRQDLAGTHNTLEKAGLDADNLHNQATALGKELASARSTLDERQLEADGLHTQTRMLKQELANSRIMVDKGRLETQTLRKENSGLLKHLGELERQLSKGLIWTLMGNCKGMMMRIARWIWLKPKLKLQAGADVV